VPVVDVGLHSPMTGSYRPPVSSVDGEEVLARHHEEARRSARRIADYVGRLRRGQLDHEPDDVTRRAELTILTGAGDLGEHVLVDVALCVAFFHGYVVEQVHHFRQ